ncbi:hypothetical protein [Salinibacter ruber]|jgi:hypothetical protein|uniref:hypothetical protein n=1 Tax=Salinibacter ruber TaxID=146919 RepID=UPI002073F749|nr:hypothetical protein [Salinibacter ruber]MCS4198187.1 hypothetical protein [Salinibacter ruber]
MNQLASPGALNGFADEVAERVTESGTGPFVIFGPKWAQDGEGAEPPPDELSDPAWGRGVGWMEKEDAPIETGPNPTGNEPMSMYAPDSVDELDVTDTAEANG